MTTELESLRKHSRIVADTAEYNTVLEYKPTDITTDPANIFLAAEKDEYRHIIEEAVAKVKHHLEPIEKKVEEALERSIVGFGVEITKHITGKVSTQIDPSFSFDTDGMVVKALNMISLYEEAEVPIDRYCIKLPATWEGIQAAKRIKSVYYHACVNMTLVFNLVQAAACADIHADIISPFVCRIPFFSSADGADCAVPVSPKPSVVNVQTIFAYMKHYGYKSEIMAASIRESSQAKDLCGITSLTLPENVLKELANTVGEVEPFLLPTDLPEKLSLSETQFRWLMNIDTLASASLEAGIKLYDEQTNYLRKFIRSLL